MTNNEGEDGEHPTASSAEAPRKGTGATKDFQTGNDTKDANQTNMNEIPARAQESTAEAAEVPGAERRSRIEDGGLSSEGVADFQGFRFSGSRTQEARLWFGLAVVLLALGLNKQLDLQTLLIQIGREIAVSQGWIEERRRVQLFFVVAAVFGGGLGMITLGWRWRRFLRNYPALLTSIGLLVFYVLLRVASIDHVEDVVGFVIPDEAWWLAGMELSGIACIGFTAWQR